MVEQHVQPRKKRMTMKAAPNLNRDLGKRIVESNLTSNPITSSEDEEILKQQPREKGHIPQTLVSGAPQLRTSPRSSPIKPCRKELTKKGTITSTLETSKQQQQLGKKKKNRSICYKAESNLWSTKRWCGVSRR